MKSIIIAFLLFTSCYLHTAIEDIVADAAILTNAGAEDLAALYEDNDEINSAITNAVSNSSSSSTSSK